MIQFKNIPANVRRPDVYIEESSSLNIASPFGNLRTVLLAQTNNNAVAVPTLVTSANDAATLFGAGSVAHKMAKSFFDGTSAQEVYVLPCDVSQVSTDFAKWTYTVSAAANGVANLYLGGYRISQSYTLADVSTSPATLASGASALAAIINADPNAPVTATSAAAVVTITAKAKGVVGNDLKIAFDLNRGEASNLAGTLAQTVVATATADLASVLASIGDFNAYYWVTSFRDDVNIAALSTFLDARHAPGSRLRGIGIYSVSGSVSSVVSQVASRNNRHLFTLATEATTQDEAHVISAMFGAAIVTSAAADPSRQMRGRQLYGKFPVKEAFAFSKANRELLLNNKLSTYVTDSAGVARLTRVISNNTLNELGSADEAYLDIMTRLVVDFISRDIETMFDTLYMDAKLASDGLPLFEGSGVVTPASVKSDLYNRYVYYVEDLNICESPSEFLKNTRVERNASDMNRLDILYVPNLVNNLMVSAIKLSFVL